MDKLTERQQKILELIVKEYVDNPKPVSSKALARDLGLSSATLRNEMTELKSSGYLTQPHTSAGRIPTEKAYRFFIGQPSKDIFEKQFNHLCGQVGVEMIRTQRYSLIITQYKTLNKKREIIGLISPIRMRYDYNIELINKLKEMLEDFEI